MIRKKWILAWWFTLPDLKKNVSCQLDSTFIQFKHFSWKRSSGILGYDEFQCFNSIIQYFEWKWIWVTSSVSGFENSCFSFGRSWYCHGSQWRNRNRQIHFMEIYVRQFYNFPGCSGFLGRLTKNVWEKFWWFCRTRWPLRRSQL